MKKLFPTPLVLLLLCFICFSACAQQRLMENLDRGLIAIPQQDGSVAVSWRVLGTDPDALTFNLYRKTAAQEPVKIYTAQPGDPSFFTDTQVDLSKENTWYVTTTTNGKEENS